jgi:hypothetical protein
VKEYEIFDVKGLNVWGWVNSKHIKILSLKFWIVASLALEYEKVF